MNGLNKGEERKGMRKGRWGREEGKGVSEESRGRGWVRGNEGGRRDFYYRGPPGLAETRGGILGEGGFTRINERGEALERRVLGRPRLP